MGVSDSSRLKPSELLAATGEITSYIRQLEQATDPWSFVESLRLLRSTEKSEVWRTARDARMPVLWVRGDGLTYTADTATVQAIRRGSIRLSRLTMQKRADRPPSADLRCGLELSWFAGYHASGQLTPRLPREAAYRVGRWPNFGLIRPLPSQLRVATALASGPVDLREIAARARVSKEEAIRTLNALYACDLLEVRGTVDPAERARLEASGGGLTKLLDSVRKRFRGGAD